MKTRETWKNWNTKTVWEFDGYMWRKVGIVKVGERNFR